MWWNLLIGLVFESDSPTVALRQLAFRAFDVQHQQKLQQAHRAALLVTFVTGSSEVHPVVDATFRLRQDVLTRHLVLVKIATAVDARVFPPL